MNVCEKRPGVITSPAGASGVTGPFAEHHELLYACISEDRLTESGIPESKHSFFDRSLLDLSDRVLIQNDILQLWSYFQALADQDTVVISRSETLRAPSRLIKGN